METVYERQAFRETIAAKQNAEIAKARAILGPAVAYGKWMLVDSEGIEPTRIVFCRRIEGQIGWHPSAEEAFGETLILTKSTNRFFEHNGERLFLHRYQLRMGALEEYHPMNPDVLQKRNDTRIRNKAAKALAAACAAMPLLADQITKETVETC